MGQKVLMTFIYVSPNRRYDNLLLIFPKRREQQETIINLLTAINLIL